MSQDQVELVKQKADIVSIVDGRVKLIKAGRNLKANCPFHGEKTPSFFVSPELQTFKCFGCGEGGDVFTFLQKYEGMDFPEALEYVAGKVGVELKRDLRNNDEQQRKRLLEVLHLAEEYYHFLLTQHKVGENGLAYLKKRGITDGIIKTFKLGYSADSWQGLIDYLVGKKKYKIEDLEKTGMVIKSGGGRYYDRFRGRVMFPLKDFSGKTVGFSGRVLPGENVDPSTGSGQVEKEAKYINSPETELYHKSKMLYGMNEVRSNIRKKNRVVVVEGEFDMISSYKSGVREVVAIKGSALTDEQVELIRKITNNIILALDADAAGNEATKRGITIADKMGMNLSVVEVVEGKDPDDLATKKPELWKKLINSPVSVYDFLIRKSFEKHDEKSGPGKKAISKELSPILSSIDNLVEREHYLGVVSDKLSVSKQVLENEMIKVEKLGKSLSKNEEKPKRKYNKRQNLERFVVGCFLQMSGDLLAKYKIINEEILSDMGVNKLWSEMGDLLNKNPNIAIREMIAGLPMESQRLVEELFVPEVLAFGSENNDSMEMFQDGVKDLQKMAYMERLKKVSVLMTEEKSSDEDLEKLQQEYAVLTRKLKELT